MKRLFLLLLLGCGTTACIDKDYDLSQLEFGNATIGDETTVLKMPLARITVGKSQFSDSGRSIDDLFDEADAWLPATMPDGNSYVDIVRLRNDADYYDAICSALMNELRSDAAKCDDLAAKIWENHYDDFRPVVGNAVSAEQFRTLFRSQIGNRQLEELIRATGRDYLGSLRLDDVYYELGHIGLGSDVIDQLASNLDPEGTPDPRNTLHLYGTIVSSLPLEFGIEPVIEPTDVTFRVTVTPGTPAEIEPAILYADDLRKIVDNARIRIPVSLNKYYPGTALEDGQQVGISLSLRKKGGLKFDI